MDEKVRRRQQFSSRQAHSVLVCCLRLWPERPQRQRTRDWPSGVLQGNLPPPPLLLPIPLLRPRDPEKPSGSTPPNENRSSACHFSKQYPNMKVRIDVAAPKASSSDLTDRIRRVPNMIYMHEAQYAKVHGADRPRYDREQVRRLWQLYCFGTT